MGFPFFNLAHVPFLSSGAPATSLHCSRYDITYFSALLLPLGLRAEVIAMPISYVIHSFGLYYPTFLLGQSI